MLYCLNYYLKKDGSTVYKFVRDKRAYTNSWILLETYYFYDGRIITYKAFMQLLSKKSKKSSFKKLLEFFRKL